MTADPRVNDAYLPPDVEEVCEEASAYGWDLTTRQGRRDALDKAQDRPPGVHGDTSDLAEVLTELVNAWAAGTGPFPAESDQ